MYGGFVFCFCSIFRGENNIIDNYLCSWEYSDNSPICDFFQLDKNIFVTVQVK